MDEPSLQLQLEMRDALVRALATRRPILHHLNADTSWLLQIPRPANAVKHGARIYYNVLIDPWFVGGQSDVAKWFSQQWHATESAVKSIAEVEEIARQIELLAGGLQVDRSRKRKYDMSVEEAEESYVDCVAISHEFTDHCHKETLLEVHGDVPVFATEQATALITSWNHFRTIVTTPTFPDHADWHDFSLPPLPSWLGISRLTAAKDSLFYHSALLFTFATHPFLPNTTPRKRLSTTLSINGDGAELMSSSPATGSTGSAAESIIYTPHGIPHTALSPIATADPPLHTLAFLHGLHAVSLSSAQQLNLGAKNGVLAQRMLRAKYWIGTHDEEKKGGGLVSWFLRRKVWTLDEALREARRELGEEEEADGGGGVWEDVKFQELRNGESRVLE